MRPVKGILGWALAAALVAAAPAAQAGASLAGTCVSYAIQASVSTALGGQTLGVWPLEGRLSLAFSERDEEGRQRITLKVDRLEAPDLPGSGQWLAGLAGQEATFVFDRGGRLVDLELPLPEEVREKLRSRLSALPPAETPAGSLSGSLSAIRPGTSASFRLASPRDTGAGHDEVNVEIEFAGPGERPDVYAVLLRLTFDAATQAPAELEKPPVKTSSKGQLQGAAGFRLDNGLLDSLDLEMALTTGTEEAPVDLGLRLAVRLLADS